MRNTIVVITCDLCEDKVTPLGEEVELELGSKAIHARRVTLDLCDAHVTELVDETKRYADAGRVLTTKRAPRAVGEAVGSFRGASRTSRPARRDPEQTTAIRTWARANGFTIADRGRIPAEVEKAYNFRKAS